MAIPLPLPLPLPLGATTPLLNHHHHHQVAVPVRRRRHAVRNDSMSLVAAAPTTLVFQPQFDSAVYNYKKKPIINAAFPSSSALTRTKRLHIIVPRAVSASPGAESSEVTSENLLDGVQVFDLNGSKVAISELWRDRKAVVAFARHFGCVLCRRRAGYLASHKEKMDAAGVALALIGPGSVDQARAFAEQTKFRGEVYADPSHSSYEALRFVSGVSTTFTPGAGLKIIQAYMEGYRQDWGLSFEKETRTRGGWQQGGIIVAGPGKHNISYIHKDKEAGDDPDIEDVLRACCP
ncbi:thioredoxin-like protein AAED1, chloroplastic isoform X1 [Coffea arabica]|uniref:Thioredoxin-like protein AAED1, chloroplastic isoform X1 n=1 Tax=Coffea arabica TaxID=13443 RepID=A0ABM4UT43_COFAR|nr:thioredoxin-like protein AAED1, chloroplastic isoform X2 [Coffea arabica]